MAGEISKNHSRLYKRSLQPQKPRSAVASTLNACTNSCVDTVVDRTPTFQYSMAGLRVIFRNFIGHDCSLSHIISSYNYPSWRPRLKLHIRGLSFALVTPVQQTGKIMHCHNNLFVLCCPYGRLLYHGQCCMLSKWAVLLSPSSAVQDAGTRNRSHVHTRRTLHSSNMMTQVVCHLFNFRTDNRTKFRSLVSPLMYMPDTLCMWQTTSQVFYIGEDVLRLCGLM